MKKTTLILLAVTFAALAVLLGCKRSGSSELPPDVAYYTCPMHPSVKLKDPKAKCPICGMDLVPVKKKAAETNAADYYTCAMHPSVKSKDPKAKCPLCSMDLTPVKKSAASGEQQTNETFQVGHEHSAHAGNAPGATVPVSASDEKPSEFVVPVERQQMIGVTYATAQKQPLHRSLRAVGNVTYEKQRRWNFVSRVEGYVQKLQVSSRGEVVEKNQPLLTLYSPELLTSQRELLDLLRARDRAKEANSDAVLESTERMIEAAKRRLSLWNVSSNQIAEMEKTRQPQETLTFYSPFKGVVQNIGVDQGKRVMVGEPLVDVADLSVAWVWADFYEEELPLLKCGLPVTLTSSSYPNENFKGKISLVDPFINESTRTGRARIDVENADLKLRPEMYVNVTIELHEGEGLVVPISSVIPTGQRNIVFVDKSEGKLEPRFLELGGKFGTNYAVKAGLNEGERVVASANFLIDAESKIQGALKSW